MGIENSVDQMDHATELKLLYYFGEKRKSGRQAHFLPKIRFFLGKKAKRHLPSIE